MEDQLNACKQLLHLSTQAQAGKPADKSIPPLSNEDRAFLEEALKEATNGNIMAKEPVEQLKVFISQLKDNSLEQTALAELVEQVVDLVCSIDLAMDFCKLGGLEIIKQYMIPTTSDEASDVSTTHALFASLLGVISQNNPAVQEQLLSPEYKNFFLTNCLETIANKKTSETHKLKCVGAISSMVKGYSPALKELSRQKGVKLFEECFKKSLQNKEAKLVERLAIVVANIVLSFESNSIVEETQVVDLLKHIYDNLVVLRQSGSNKHSNALEYIESNESLMDCIAVKK